MAAPVNGNVNVWRPDTSSNASSPSQQTIKLQQLAARRRTSRSSVVARASATEDVTQHQKAAVDTFANPCFDEDSVEGAAPSAVGHQSRTSTTHCGALQAVANNKRRHERRSSCARSQNSASRVVRQHGAGPAHFEGDISTWGRRDDGSSEGEGSLSSGISPREAAQRRPWDQSAGMLALALESERYGHAAAAAAYGGAEAGQSAGSDLATRLAAQQMGTLAGMSRKVQEALQHSQRAFRARLAHTDRAATHAAFRAWARLRSRKAVARQVEVRSVRRMHHWRLQRIWRSWLALVREPDMWTRRLRQARVLLSRHQQQRALAGWGAVCAARAAALQLSMRDHEILALSQQVRAWELVPIRALTRYRQRAQLHDWASCAARSMAKKRALTTAQAHRGRRMMRSIFAGWSWCASAAVEAAEARSCASAVLQRKRLRRQLQAWAALPKAAAGQRYRRALAHSTALRHGRGTLSKAWAGLRWWAHHSRQRRRASGLGNQQPARAVLVAWIKVAARQHRRAAAVDQCRASHHTRLLRRVLDAWVDATDDAAADAGEAAFVELRRRLAATEAEGSRLAAENRRYGRLIDNPDWDPKTQAAEREASTARLSILEAENAALREAAHAAQNETATAMALLPARRRTTVEAAARSSATLARLTASRRASREAAGAQVLRPLRPSRPAKALAPKQAPKLTPQSLAGFAAPNASGGKVVGHHLEAAPQPPPPATRPGSARVLHHHHVDADARNRMLIQGGSSFNALVKALRQQASDSEAESGSPTPRRQPAKEPARNFDKLSMNSVEVHPDGSLSVQALPAYRFPHASRFTTKSSAAHVAFGVSSHLPPPRTGAVATNHVAATPRPPSAARRAAAVSGNPVQGLRSAAPRTITNAAPTAMAAFREGHVAGGAQQQDLAPQAQRAATGSGAAGPIADVLRVEDTAQEDSTTATYGP